jgi:hypothetical protein
MISKLYLKWLIISYPRRRNVLPGKVLQLLIRIYLAKGKSSEQNIEVRKFIQINSYGTSSLSPEDVLPEIEVLVPAAIKDIEISKLTVISVIETSRNPISDITLVVPQKEVKTFEEYFRDLETVNLKFVGEEDLVGTELLQTIKKEYAGRAGWVLAEFIKYIFTSKSKKLGVLIIDADTILTENRIWLTSDLQQNIFPVFEYHKHYFEFLEFLGVPLAGTEISYMSHFMLFQPSIYREMVKNFKSNNPMETLRLLIEFPSKNPHSPVCFCYEAYAHFAKYKYPDRVVDAKWSNVQVAREEFLKRKGRYLRVGKKHFSSISTHAYLP